MTVRYQAALLLVFLSLVDATSPRCEKRISRTPGQSVTLQFNTVPDVDSVRLKRKDSNKYIDFCIDGHNMEDEYQEEGFKGRVEGFNCSRMDGNFSVTVTNLTTNDTGVYEWLAKKGEVFNKTICLHIGEPRGWTVGVIIGVIVAVAVALAAGVLIFSTRRRRRTTCPPGLQRMNWTRNEAFCHI